MGSKGCVCRKWYICTRMDQMQIIEIIAATIGIVYVWLEMRASRWLWPVGIVLPLFYIYISWVSQVYGNIVVNVYYIIACVLGWIAWHRSRGEAEDDTYGIRYMPRRTALLTLGVALLLLLAIVPLLKVYMHSPYPLWDGIATSVSLVGMWLLAKKYVETWYCWILSNVIYCVLYFLQGFTVTGLFFVVYSVVSFMGWHRWHRLQEQTDR